MLYRGGELESQDGAGRVASGSGANWSARGTCCLIVKLTSAGTCIFDKGTEHRTLAGEARVRRKVGAGVVTTVSKGAGFTSIG